MAERQEARESGAPKSDSKEARLQEIQRQIDELVAERERIKGEGEGGSQTRD